MSEEEKLTLDIEATYNDTDLDDLEEDLNAIDRAIADSGRGQRKVGVDVEVDSHDALVELEAIDAAIDHINDKEVNIDTDVDEFESAASTASPQSPSEPSIDTDNIEVEADGMGANQKRDVIAQLISDDDSGVTASNLNPEFDTEFESRDVSDAIGLLDEIGDDEDRRRRSFLGTLSNQARELGSEFKDARFTMEQFHAIFASLVPLAVVFIGAMPAAITALAGLAGAALAATAAVGAIGLLGLGGMALTGSGELDIQPILERMQGIFDTFITAFTPLMNRFQPLVESAFDTLEGLANPLASAMAPLTMFESTFEGLIESVAAGLPSFTTKVLAFAQATMPMLMSIANFFENADFIGFFANQLEKARFTFILLGFALKEIVPFLINFSQGFLLVASGIIGVLGVIGGLIDAVPYLTFGLGALIAAGLLLVSITSLLTVVGFALEHQLYAQTAALLGNVKAEIAATIATYGLAKSIAFLIGVITLGVGALVALGAAGSFVADRFNLANSELSEFNKLAGNMPNSIGGQFGSPTAMGRGGGSNAYNIDINASSPEESRRASNRVKYEIRNTEQVNSVFGGN